jgi:lipopolysaccharide export system permease protein
VRLGAVAQAVGLLVPFVGVFALPMGMLTATLLIFGRASADHELTAVRASGVSLLWLASPVLFLSLVLCALSALVNLELGPRCRVAYVGLRNRLTAEFSSAILPEGRVIKDFEGYIFYTGKNRKGELEDVWVFSIKDHVSTHALRGQLVISPDQFELRMYNATIVTERGENDVSFEELPIIIPRTDRNKGDSKPSYSDMTFTQLRSELTELEHFKIGTVSGGTSREQLQAWKAECQEWEQRREKAATSILFHLHREVAFSFACFGFTLIGIPLGIRVHRRETNIGIAIALLLVAVYYAFILVGQALQTRADCAPYLIVWLPNFVFQAAGAVLLWRANRGI